MFDCRSFQLEHFNWNLCVQLQALALASELAATTMEKTTAKVANHSIILMLKWYDIFSSIHTIFAMSKVATATEKKAFI